MKKLKQKIIFSALLTISALAFYIIVPGHEKKFRAGEETENHSVAYDALQFIGSAAAFPGVDIPPEAYGKAWNQYQKMYSGSAEKIQGTAAWQSIGPQNVGGRTISIALDPVDTNIIWLGSASGGLWKSVTGGYGLNAWQYVPTGFPVLGVGSVAINPLNKNEMYIGTGETYDYGTSVNGLVIRTTRGSSGIGILKTSDGGATWTQVLNWNYNQQRSVWDIIINPVNPATVYAATTEGIYKSTDAGITWAQLLGYTMVMDLAMDPQDTSVLYAGVGNLTSPVHGIYKTDNAGASWTHLTNGLPSNNSGRISIDIYQGNSNIVMAHVAQNFVSAGLYRSTDKGQSWMQVSADDIASVQGWYAKCLIIKDDDSNHVLAGGVALFESVTGGSNLVPITSYIPGGIDSLPWSDMHGLISNPYDANKIYLLTDAGLYRSNDFGITWRWCANGYNVSQFYHGSVLASDSNLLLAGLQDRNSYRYNGTLNWKAVSGGDGTFNAIDQQDPSIQFAASQYLYIGQSIDSGYTFFGIFSGSTPAFVAPFMLAPSDNSMIYAGDEYINYSPDQGLTWINSGPVDNFNPIISMDVSVTDKYKIYFATAPTSDPFMHVFISNDAGQSYNDISTGLPNRYPRDIAVDPQNDSIAYIAFSGFGSGHVFKTTNNGSSWTDISTALPDIPYHTVLVDPGNSSIIFAGSDLGVFISADAGSTWQALNAGLPLAVMVFDLEYSASDNTLVAFTHGHGVYKLDLDNLNLGIPLVSTSITNIKIYPTIVNQILNVGFYSRSADIIIFSLYDESGKIIFKQEQHADAGINRKIVALPEIPDGIYFFRFEGKGSNALQKIIKYK
jgi:photosystem II stability/assembly factor-like uncharacterized protein